MTPPAHQEHVAAGVDEVAQRLIVLEDEARAVVILRHQLVAQRVELRLEWGEGVHPLSAITLSEAVSVIWFLGRRVR